MRIWVITDCMKWEGETVRSVLSDDGLTEYPKRRPAFRADSYGGYTTHEPNATSWYDITPYDVDSELEA
jgi:hypothetical protein